jgi:hypothetical protein
VRIATMNEDQVQYALKPSNPDLAKELEEMEVPGSMSPKTALMAGLVLGITMMIGLLGFLAWRDKQRADDLQMKSAAPIVSTAPSAQTTAPAPSAVPSAAPSK